jgi:hypothetical protein
LWRAGTTGPAITTQQVADAPPGFFQSIKISVTTPDAAPAAGDFCQIYSPFEGTRFARLQWGTVNAQPLSIGFYAKAHRPGLYSGSIRSGGGSARAYVFSFTITAADTWQFVTLTIPGDTTPPAWPTSAAQFANFGVCLMSGTTYQGPAGWQNGNIVGLTGTINGVAAATDTFQITGVIMLPGIELPSVQRLPFIMRNFNQELLLCQRYLAGTYTYGQAFGTASSQSYITMFAESANQLFGNYSLPAVLRAAPTIYMWSYAGTASTWSNSGGVDVTAGTINSPGDLRTIASGAASGAGVTLGHSYLCHIVCDARM